MEGNDFSESSLIGFVLFATRIKYQPQQPSVCIYLACYWRIDQAVRLLFNYLFASVKKDDNLRPPECQVSGMTAILLVYLSTWRTCISHMPMYWGKMWLETDCDDKRGNTRFDSGDRPLKISIAMLKDWRRISWKYAGNIWRLQRCATSPKHSLIKFAHGPQSKAWWNESSLTTSSIHYLPTFGVAENPMNISSRDSVNYGIRRDVSMISRQRLSLTLRTFLEILRRSTV